MEQLLVAGRYRLLDPVGSGGMGRVWLARDEMLHRDVAVKQVVPPAWLSEPERDELRLRTLREARFGLIPGWTWYVDPTGFRIAAPVDWLRWTDGAVTCFREPGGSRLLTVGAGAAPADPVVHWRAEERRLTDDGALPGYRRVEIAPLDLYRGGAVWECGWVNAAADQVHTARLLVTVSPTRAYTVSWLTREFDWQVNATYFLMIRQSFRPGP